MEKIKTVTIGLFCLLGYLHLNFLKMAQAIYSQKYKLAFPEANYTFLTDCVSIKKKKNLSSFYCVPGPVLCVVHSAGGKKVGYRMLRPISCCPTTQ